MGVPGKGSKAAKAKSAQTSEVKPDSKATPRKKSKAKLVSQMIERLEQKISKDELKPTVGDFIRLLQLEKDLEEEQPREIKVSWVEPSDKGHAPDK